MNALSHGGYNKYLWQCRLQSKRNESEEILAGVEEEEEEEEESEYETDTDEEQVGRQLMRPVFVKKQDRDTIAEREAQEQAELDAMNKEKVPHFNLSNPKTVKPDEHRSGAQKCSWLFCLARAGRRTAGPSPGSYSCSSSHLHKAHLWTFRNLRSGAITLRSAHAVQLLLSDLPNRILTDCCFHEGLFSAQTVSTLNVTNPKMCFTGQAGGTEA